jgi:hypothetical protein
MPDMPRPFGDPDDEESPLRRSTYSRTDVRRLPPDRDRVPMYFEYPLDEQLHVDIAGEEINVAVDINGGRALALTPFRSPYDEPPPTVDPDFCVTTASGGRLEDLEAYSDSIADLLQAGKFAGWNPEDLCRRALSLRARVELEGQVTATELRGPREPQKRRVRAPRHQVRRPEDA